VAVHSRRKDLLDLLLELGLDPDEPVWNPEAKQYRRGGPLALCAETGQAETADAPLARGATLTPPIAIWLAKSEWLREKHIAGKLENPLTSEGGLLTLAIRRGRREIVELLLDLGFDPNERHRAGAEEERYSGGAPLRSCVKQNDLEVARLLLDRGPTPTDKTAITARLSIRLTATKTRR
jgi:hypothetical protein